jgi:Amt family ammonium transporter
VIAALILAKVMFGKADLTMALNGALAGLVSITAGPLAPSIQFAAIIGAVGGVIVVLSIVFLDKLKIDDPVGAISVHGTAGIWGIIAVAFTAEDFGGQLMGQLIGILGIFGWTFGASLVVWGVLKAVMGLRISEEEEYEGSDLTECGLEAYPEFVKSS